jgi:predicted enzyme related to lactoylglutathione lyase
LTEYNDEGTADRTAGRLLRGHQQDAARAQEFYGKLFDWNVAADPSMKGPEPACPSLLVEPDAGPVDAPQVPSPMSTHRAARK